MNRGLLYLFGIIFISGSVYAQVTFPAGTNLCESNPWKLVWYDEFDGTGINNNKWFTFLDDNNWVNGEVAVPPVSQESRTMNRGANFLDANVTVSNGTCKLTAKYQPNTWFNSYKLYSSGLIKARKSGTNIPMYFNKGKFEMKARISKAVNVWAAYWLWQGGGHPGGNSEIDIFEYMPTNNADENTYSLHGWQRPGVFSDPTTITGAFSYYNINSYHIYTCEWDNNYVTIYMDNQLKYQGSRYTLPGAPYTAIGCEPATGTSYVADIHKAFPFADEYMSLICSMDYRENPDANMPDRVFEIDYIRVYQRIPQPDLSDLCSYVTGPANICLNVPVTYYATVGSESIFTNWTVSANVQIISTGTTNGQPYATVKGISDGMSWITANMNNAPYSCSPAHVQVAVGAPPPDLPGITTNATSNPGKKSITITFPAPPPGVTYTWNVSSAGGASYSGSNEGVRSFLMLNGDVFSYYIYSTTACGESEWTNHGYKLVNGVLMPYELPKPGRSDEPDDLLNLLGESESGLKQSAFTLYPNLVSDVLYINRQGLSGCTLKIMDMSGRVMLEKGNVESKVGIDVSDFASGIYYLELNVKGQEITRLKFVKK